MRTRNKLLLFSLLLSSTAVCAELQVKYFAGLKSPDEDERNKTYWKALDERKSRINELLQIIKQPIANEAHNGSVYHAIRLIGKLRAVEAVPVLVTRLTFLPKPGRIISAEVVPREEYYPAVRSLIEIGVPSDVTFEMIRILSNPSDDLHRELAAYVLIEIHGQKRAYDLVAGLQIKPIPKALEEAAKYIQNYKPRLGYPKR
jgi:hypothetical protein